MGVAPTIILYLIPAATSAALAVYGWRRRAQEDARCFSLMMAAVALWSVCHVLSAASRTLEGVLLWAQIQYAGIVLVAPLWLLFGLAYANRWARTTPRLRLGLLAPAALALAAVLTNGWHGLWWPQAALDTTRSFGSLMVTRGPLFWLHTVYSYGCVLVGLGLFISAMLDSQLVYRNQARLVVLGALFPIVGNLAHLLGVQVRAVDDPTPFLFTASGAIMFFATRRYQLLDLAPIAQQQIFESMPDGVVVLDHRGVVAAINGAAARLLAVAPEAWVGRAAAELAHSSPLAAELRPLLAAPFAPTSRSVTFAGAEGQRTVEARLRPLNVRSRARGGALLLLQDTTEHVRMARALDRRVAELTLLNRIAGAANAVAQTDDMLRTIAGEIVRTMAWDRIAIGILQPDGATLRVAIDQPSHDTRTYEGSDLPADDFAIVHEMLRAGQARALDVADPTIAGTPTEATLRLLELRTMLVVPLYRQTEPLGILFVGHAEAQSIVPAQLRLYETIGDLVGDAIIRTRLYEEARQASALKSAFLATMTHELRTPLTSIIGYADMLQHGFFEALPASAEEPIGHIRHSGATLLHMINAILDFSKMEAGPFHVDLYPVDLVAVIQSVAGSLRPQIYERGLALKIDLDPELPLAYANTTRIEQVLTNLLANAIKFTEQGGIVVRAGAEGDHIRFSVQDTGIGIAPEDLPLLFQPFHQIENQNTRRFKGTGLGLAITRRLIELMDGAIWLESTPGVGTTFFCDLRMAPVGALKAAAVSE